MASSAERTALVTGASRGIGRAVAAMLVQRGLRVVMVARTRTTLEPAARAAGAIPLVGDVADADQVTRLAATSVDELGDVPDIVVNAAGAFELAPLVETSVAAFDAMIAANLRAPFMLTHAFLPRMLARGSGHIVSIGSVAGRLAFPGNGAYSASKFGLRALHQVLDAELKGTGVRATLVEPAATDTPLWDDIDYAKNPGLPERSQMLSVDAVAEAVLFAIDRPSAVAIKYLGIERA